MFTTFILLTLACAGMALIWRDLLIDFPRLKTFVKERIPFPFSKALTCGSCFTYWLGLAFVLVFDPLAGWTLPSALDLGRSYPLVHLIVAWMAFGTVAVTMRFTAVAVQELVAYQTHVLNPKACPSPAHDHPAK